MKNLTVKIKDALTNLVAYVKGRVGYIWNRIKTGQEPIVVRGFVVAIVALAAMFGQVIDPNTVWLILAFLVPAAVSARGQVTPAEEKDRNSWLKRLKDLALGKYEEEPNIHPPQEPDVPDVPVDDNDVQYDDGPVQPDADEPDWLDDFIDDVLGDEAEAEGEVPPPGGGN